MFIIIGIHPCLGIPRPEPISRITEASARISTDSLSDDEFFVSDKDSKVDYLQPATGGSTRSGSARRRGMGFGFGIWTRHAL